MKKRQILCSAVALALLLGLLGGCSSNSAESTGSSTAPEASGGATAVSQEEEASAVVSYPIYDEPVSFTWVDIRNKDYEQGVVTEGLAENEVYKYVSNLTGINIEWDLRNDSATTYGLLIAGGDYPDCWGSKFTDAYPSLENAYNDGVIMDITDLIDEYMPNYSAALSSEESLYKNSFTENGYHLAVGSIQTGYTQFGAQVRGDILDKLGIQAPVTYDDMYNMLTAMKSAYPDSQPLILSKDGSMNCSWLGGGLGVCTTVGWRPSYSLNLYQVDGTVKLGLLEPEYKEYISMLAKWYSEGLIYKDFYLNEGMGPPQDVIAADTAFAWYGSVNEIPTLTAVLEDDGAYIKGMSDVVRNEGDIIHLGDTTERTIKANSGYPISTSCQHPEYILQYFDYLYSDEGYTLANYGTEGETYTLVDGKPTYTDMILNNTDYTYVSALYKYCLYEGPFELDVNRYFVSFDDAQKEAVELWESNRDESWNIPSAATLTTEESERSGQIMADLGTYCSEMIMAFILGDKDVDANWDEFQSQLDALGANEIIQLNQTALDRYNN